MATALSSTEHTAIKQHNDDGGQYFDWMIIRDENKKRLVDPKEAEYLKLTPEEVKQIQHSVDNNWKILPGEKYVKQASVDGGDFYSYKTRSAIHEICCKYSLYSED